MVCNLLLLGSGRTPFWSAHWMLFASRSVVARRGAYRHSTLRIGCCCSCRLLLLGRGGTPFCSALWTLLALRSVVARRGWNAILVCALDAVCFAVSCCSVVAERHFALHFGHCLLRGLLLPGGGHIAILLCALDVVCFAVCCYSVGAERHFGLRIGCCLLRGLLLLGSGRTPFWSAHWRLLLLQTVVTR